MSTAHPGRFQSIVVPLDGSPLAEQAIPMAQAIAERARCRLKLVLIHQPLIMMEPGPNYTKVELAMYKADREYLKLVTARLRQPLGRSVSSAILDGSPVAQTLAAYIRELGADLVVMMSHGRGGLGRAWLGSVTDQLIRFTEIPVLVVRTSEDMEPKPGMEQKEILVALDGSPLAEAALGPAVALARLWDAEVSLVQVVQAITLGSAPHLTFPSDYSDQVTAIRRDSAQDYISDMAERVRESGVRASGVAVVGAAVAETLIKLAAPDRVGLMAVATHGQGGLKRLVLGSVADKLVRGAPVPVLVVRPTGRHARRKSGGINVPVTVAAFS
ncbi:MAG TPA: universal stress protein [Gemmatimonadales bacterium]|jgi:nucleotide-binding universal stress UspA family protein|nr:universal stress protein [Gemmatimonadales bacterium]